MDFYWLHRDDPEKPAEEIVDILEELKKEGRIRYYGFSNYRTERLKEIAQCLRERNLSGITAVSNQWSLAGINPGGNTNPDPTLVEPVKIHLIFSQCAAALIQVHADIFFVHSAAARILKGIVRALRCHNNFSLHGPG